MCMTHEIFSGYHYQTFDQNYNRIIAEIINLHVASVLCQGTGILSAKSSVWELNATIVILHTLEIVKTMSNSRKMLNNT